MKPIALFILMAAVAAGCSDRVKELEQQKAAAENVNRQLSQDIAARDEYVDKVADAINDVYSSIEEVKAKEKSLLRETNALETGKQPTREEVRAKLIDKINLIKTTLSTDQNRLADLQHRLSTSKKRYSGLEKMVESLKKNIDERDQAIADLRTRVDGLQQEITEKTQVITQKDSVIGVQYRQITTAYYITGTRDELEKKGIITKEGGFLWGLLGSTTTLTNGFDDKYFKPINKDIDNTIEVNGKIDEIIPRRGEGDYQKTAVGEDRSMLTIANPGDFWKDKYLVIITDRPSAD